MGKILMKGNEAIGEAAVRAGCLNYFAYPITPQSEVAEYLSRRLPEVGGVFLPGSGGAESTQSISKGQIRPHETGRNPLRGLSYGQ